MPDHIHLLLLGIREEADLYLAARFLRQHTAPQLVLARYQKQGYDHVLRENERERGAFAAVAYYIAENPVRAGLCAKASEYAYSGCMIPAYPSLDIHAGDFWEGFWRYSDAIGNKSGRPRS
jgi:hypothetical protein